MKTDRSMIRTLGLLALSLLATATVHEAHADAMRPSYRIEDLGLVSKWGGINPRFSPDGTVHRYDQVPGPYGAGEYRLEAVNEGERTVKMLLFKGDNPTNLFTEEQSRYFAGRAQRVTADGKILMHYEPTLTDNSIYDVNTGQMTLIKSSSEIGNPGSKAQVYAINSLGQMVGQQDSNEIFYEGFDATPLLLKDLVENLGDWKIYEVSDLSETGEIIVSAYGGISIGEHTLKLAPITPVPEPGTFLIIASASAIYGYRRWRSRQS
ncbi:MAG: hypothetical protein NT172_21050 [Planctomycetota bacterium]|nr:hypothetical protein [Planctomycetota bacterium]